jgi:glycosyltransferase involved in cell wall biosynthesis
MKKVSIITAMYNGEKYIKQMVKSVILQTYENWELIIIDDGSNDDSLNIVKKFEDNRIKILKQNNLGQCSATNKGLSYAEGDYIMFLDCDDFINEHKIKSQVEALEDNEDNIAICKWAFFYDNDTQIKFKNEPIYFTGDVKNWLCKLWSSETMMPNSGYLIPRKVMEKAGKYYNEDLKLNIDFEYFTRIALNAKKIVYVEKSVTYYRKNVINAKTYEPSIELQLSALKSRKIAFQLIKKKYWDEEVKNAMCMSLTILAYSYPNIMEKIKQEKNELQLGDFKTFGGLKFIILQKIIGYENALKIKKYMINTKTSNLKFNENK